MARRRNNERPSVDSPSFNEEREYVNRSARRDRRIRTSAFTILYDFLKRTVDNIKIGLGILDASDLKDKQSRQEDVASIKTRDNFEAVSGAAKENIPKQQYPQTEERHGIKKVRTKNPSEIASLLKERICTVEFVRVTNPKVKRVMRCTINERYVSDKGKAMGVTSRRGLITVWDVDINYWRSFYASTVLQISYDETPGKVNT
jgi:hypothetical protein